jgi:acetyl esterase/lipase
MARLARRHVVVFVVVATTAAVLARLAWRKLPFSMPDGVARGATVLVTPYLAARDVPYRQVGGWIGRADIYRPDGDGPFPIILFFHGGGWVYGSQRDVDVWAMPFLTWGYAVVAVSYRLANVALAPAAVEDARCALAWLGAHAGEYRLDPARIVTAGTSSGGHLALMAGLVNGSSVFDGNCPTRPVPANGILNFYGVTDVADLLQRQLKTAPAGWPFAVDWLGQGANRLALAEHLSPLTWIDAGDPAVFSVHGTADAVVPYHHAVALHRALDRAGVGNELVTLPGRGHGDFSLSELADMARRMQVFLDPKLRSALVPMTYGLESIGSTAALPYNAEKSGSGSRSQLSFMT